MTLAGHRLFKKTTWVCTSHLSEFSDVFDVRTPQPKPVFLELFAGSKHISAAASMRGFETLTVDIEPKFRPDICTDICNLRRTELPGRVDVIWASIPCTVYSVLNLANHWHKVSIGYRRYWYTPATPEARQALRILDATTRLIKKLKPLYFFIENPRGALRHLPHLSLAPYRRHVHYSDYGFTYPKPTDVWTNCPHFRPIEPTGKGVLNGNGICDLNGAHTRALVPPQLISYLLDCLQFLVPENSLKSASSAATAKFCEP
jgi:site-specific DNA-cytosine methylase